jgi:hypothetical protein
VKFSRLALPAGAIQPTLEISTAHIPLRTAEALGNHGKVPEDTTLWDRVSYTFWHDYGWIIWCSEDHAEAALEAGHPELADLIQLCVDRHILRLVLDGEGVEVEGLPVFEWAPAAVDASAQ